MRSAYPGIARFGAPALFWGGVTALVYGVLLLGARQDRELARAMTYLMLASAIGSSLSAGAVGFLSYRLSHPWWVWMLGWFATAPVSGLAVAISIILVGLNFQSDGSVLVVAGTVGAVILMCDLAFAVASLPIPLAIRWLVKRQLPTADPAARPLR